MTTPDVPDCWMMPARAERRVPPFPSFPNCSRCSASIVPLLVFQMSPVQNQPEGTFRATAMGETKVVAADRIGLVLQIADTKLGADGVQVTLTAKALEVVKHAHEWTSWPKALHGTKGSAKLTREIPGTSGKQKMRKKTAKKQKTNMTNAGKDDNDDNGTVTIDDTDDEAAECRRSCTQQPPEDLPENLEVDHAEKFGQAYARQGEEVSGERLENHPRNLAPSDPSGHSTWSQSLGFGKI